MGSVKVQILFVRRLSVHVKINARAEAERIAHISRVLAGRHPGPEPGLLRIESAQG